MGVLETIAGSAQSIATVVSSLATVILGYLVYKRNSKVKQLEQQNEDLKRTIHRSSCKVNPETGRVIISEAHESICIYGINSLGPLHHCHEEIAALLKRPGKLLRVCLLNPKSKRWQEREVKENDSVQRMFTEWKASIRILKDIEINSKGDLEIRLHQMVPDRALLIVDSMGDLTPTSMMTISYYPDHPGTRGYTGGQFLSEWVLERDRDSFYKNLDYFKKAWKEATEISLDEILDGYEAIDSSGR
jgi:hypothetical protein